MRASTWRDQLGQQAERLLPLSGEQPVSGAERPDFGLDTLDFVELVLHVEQQFGFRFSAAELHDLRHAQQVLSQAARPLRRQLYAEFFAQLMQRSERG